MMPVTILPAVTHFRITSNTFASSAAENDTENAPLSSFRRIIPNGVLQSLLPLFEPADRKIGQDALDGASRAARISPCHILYLQEFILIWRGSFGSIVCAL
jgi:hypothetical protein